MKATAVASVKYEPVMVTTVPAGPLAGEKPVMAGGWMTAKFVGDMAVPVAVST